MSLKAVGTRGIPALRGGVRSVPHPPRANQEWIERRLMGELEIVRGENGSLVISSGHPELNVDFDIYFCLSF